jgi:eukaryotic-like serine/threonine-protein kinase
VVQAIADASAGRGGTWNREGVILFTPGAAGETYRVSATGGAVAAVTTSSANASQFPRWPWFLPDGKHFLYTYVDFSTNRESEVNAIWVGRLDSSEKKRLVTSSSNAAYVPGYIVFMRGNTLTAHAFDSDRLETRGEAIALESSVRYVPTVARGVFSTSQDGKLVYQTGSAVQNSQLTWFDRQGKQLATVGSLASYGNPRISPDGRKVAVDVSDPESFNADIWLIDLVRGTSSRFSFDPAQDEAPVWSPDGKRLAWFSDRQATNKIMQKVANGSGSDEPLRGLDALALIAIDDWSSDGRYLLYTSSEENARFGLWVLSLDRESKPKPFLENQFSEVQGQFSPDGRWVAYCSNESGKWQVYVTPFPGPGGKYQVSTGGGQQPRWRRDGKELFFLAPDRKLMAVPAKPGETFEAGTPVALFQTRAREPISAEEFFTYDVTSDGQRFLINSDAGEKTFTPVEIVLNWTGGLKK